jgi:thiamine biosynthesis lipoprotein ApbE
MITDTFRAMGTTIEVVAHSQDGFTETADLFSSLEHRFSRFLDHSELSRLNRSADETIQISPAMARILATATELRNRTGGLVDPAVGGAVVESKERPCDAIRVPDSIWAASPRGGPQMRRSKAAEHWSSPPAATCVRVSPRQGSI